MMRQAQGTRWPGKVAISSLCFYYRKVAAPRCHWAEDASEGRVSLTDFLMYHGDSPDFVSYARPQREARYMESTALATSSRTSWGTIITEFLELMRCSNTRTIKDIMKATPGSMGQSIRSSLNGNSAGLMASILGSVPRG